MLSLPAIQALDYVRYLFDGRLIGHGVNPYEAVPLNYPQYLDPQMPLPEIKTIYPPLAEGMFYLAYRFGDTLTSWRCLIMISDFGCAWILIKLLNQFRLPLNRMVYYYCNPLIIKEFINSAHLDALTAFWLLLFFYLWSRKKNLSALFALCCAILIKLVPVVLLIPWIQSFPKKNKQIKYIILGSLFMFLAFASFHPHYPFNSLVQFYSSIEGKGVFFFLLNLLFQPWVSRMILTILGGFLLIVVYQKKINIQNNPIMSLSLLLILYLFSTTGFPWYLAVTVPLIIIYPNPLLIIFQCITHLIYYNIDHTLLNVLLNWIGIICIIAFLLYSKNSLRVRR